MIPLSILRKHLYWYGEQWEWEAEEDREKEIYEEEEDDPQRPDGLEKFKLMVELFNPNTDIEIDRQVEKLHDDVWKGKLMIIERRNKDASL